ncbi:Type-1 cystatin cysteine protease inhibitor [Fasciola hepatica]|uniref:Type-1 cystatin cysteine protease inhibitor n=1 Tax=Fasciola hepatica TaxID=6192 RepID=A0A4E0RLA3_FASHE|nr:Type-1 cystatin cysteine protease inhibitor [Fasciola hepatica]
MSRMLFSILILLFVSHWSVEGQIVGGYSKPRPVTNAEKAQFFQVIKSKFREVGINLYSRPLIFVEVSTQVVAGTNYRFKMRSWRNKCWLIVVFKSLPRAGSRLLAKKPVQIRC